MNLLVQAFALVIVLAPTALTVALLVITLRLRREVRTLRADLDRRASPELSPSGRGTV